MTQMTFSRFLPWAMLVLTIIYSSNLILNGDGVVPHHPADQSFARNVDLTIYHNGHNWVFQYPVLSWSGGITGSLIVGFYKLIVPTNADINLNWHIKILSSLIFFFGLFWLGRSYHLPSMFQFLALGIAATSGLIFSEPSTEVLAGGFSCMLAASIPNMPSRPWLTASILVIFSLMKIELLPVGIALFFLIFLHSNITGEVRLRFMATFVFLLTILIGLSLHFHGVETFIGRGIHTFSQHYCLLMMKSDESCLAVIMPNVDSIINVILGYPKEYFHFIIASTIISTENIIVTLNLLAFAPLIFLFRSFGFHKNGVEWFLYSGTTIIFFLTVVLSITFAFVHPRYLTRSFGLLIIGLLILIRKTENQDWYVKARYQNVSNIFGLSICFPIIFLNIWMGGNTY